jgi:hypothetical protein
MASIQRERNVILSPKFTAVLSVASVVMQIQTLHIVEECQMNFKIYCDYTLCFHLISSYMHKGLKS